MAVIYGMTLATLCYLNNYAISQGQRTAVFIVVAIVSLVFGCMAGRGYA